MNARVFVVQQPTGRDDEGRVIPTFDLSPAETYGELVFVLGPTENPFADAQATLMRISNRFLEERFGDEDWVLLVGNPVLIGLMSVVAAQYSDRLRVLQWKRSARCYEPVEVQVFEDESEPEPA